MKKKSVVMLVALAAVMAILTACGPFGQSPWGEEKPSTSSEATEAGKDAAPAAPKVQVVTLTVPADTAIVVRLGEGINTGTASAGETFDATLAAPLLAEGTEVAAIGSAVTGKVTNAVSSGRLKRPAELSLVLTSLTPAGSGDSVSLSTSAWSMKGKSHKKRNVTMIGGGGGAGALIGALAGGKKGALIGGAVGAGAGTGVAAYTGKQEIQLAAETKLTFKLTAPLTFTVTQ